jgi:citrate synthase
MPATSTEVRKGLAGACADTTAISMVSPEGDSLTYRGSPFRN